MREFDKNFTGILLLWGLWLNLRVVQPIALDVLEQLLLDNLRILLT